MELVSIQGLAFLTFTDSRLKPQKPKREQPTNESKDTEQSSLTADLDDLIPTKEVVPVVAAKAAKPKKEALKEWAYVVDVNQPFPDFYEKVPELAHKVRKDTILQQIINPKTHSSPSNSISSKNVPSTTSKTATQFSSPRTHPPAKPWWPNMPSPSPKNT